MRNRQRRLLRRRPLRLLLRQRKRLQRLLRPLLPRLPLKKLLLLRLPPRLLLLSKQPIVLETNKSQEVSSFLAFFVVECFVLFCHLHEFVMLADIVHALTFQFRNALRV